jgi:MFS transporter, DHA1 family, tetracycline resistance protein
MTSTRSPAFIFIFITVALDMLALGIIIPVLPKLIEQFMGGNTARAATIVGLFSTLFAAIQFFASPVLGALSDQYGRRKVVLLSNLGLAIDYVIMALAPTLLWLVVGRVLGGITSASSAAAGAYIADVTPEEKRAQTFGMLGAAFGLGFVLGPVVGGVLGEINLHYPFYAAAIMSFLNFIYGYFVLPESLKPENRSPFRWSNANPFASLQLLASNRQLWSLSSAMMLSQLAHTVLPSIFVLYAGYRYGWNTRDVGILLGVMGLASVIAQGGLIRPIVKAVGERNSALLGLVMGAAGLIWYGTAWQGWMVWFAIPLAAMWGLFNASAQSIMSRNVSAMDQGKMQGATTSIMALAKIIGPFLFSFIFAWGIGPTRVSPLPGIGFWLAGVFLFIAAIVTNVAAKEPVRSSVDG